MGKFRVNISDLGKQDIREIASYIKHTLQEPVIARRTVDAIVDAIHTLEDNPARIALVNDARLASMQIRGLYVKNYTVFFRVSETSKIVEIIRVLYSRRDWAVLLG